jgi:hypothetical protein
MTNPDHISESLETNFRVKKYFQFVVCGSGSGIRNFFDPRSEMEKFGSGKHIPDPQHYSTGIYSSSAAYCYLSTESCSNHSTGDAEQTGTVSCLHCEVIRFLYKADNCLKTTRTKATMKEFYDVRTGFPGPRIPDPLSRTTGSGSVQLRIPIHIRLTITD